MNNNDEIEALTYSLDLFKQMGDKCDFPFPPSFEGLNGLIGANSEEIIKSFDLSNIYFLDSGRRIVKEKYFPKGFKWLE